MRALSDALPTGHRAMANPTLQLHFDCGKATPPVSHSHNWPSGRMQNFLFKIGQKSYFLPIKTPKLILTIEWYYRSMYCRSNAMIFIRPSLDGTYYGMALSVRPSVRSSVRPTVSTKKHRCKWRIFFKFCTQVCLGVPSINLWFLLSYLIKYAHNSIINDFSIFGIHRVIFLVRVFKFCTFWELVMFLDISSVFYRIPIWLFFTIILTIHLLISLGTLLARENIEGTFWFFSNSVCTCS